MTPDDCLENGVEYKYVRVQNKDFSNADPFKDVHEHFKNGWVPVREINFAYSYTSGVATIAILLCRRMRTAEVVVTEIEGDVEPEPPALPKKKPTLPPQTAMDSYLGKPYCQASHMGG